MNNFLMCLYKKISFFLGSKIHSKLLYLMGKTLWFLKRINSASFGALKLDENVPF